jgi:predicted lipoprotein with Yx(FWY)xxD motif
VRAGARREGFANASVLRGMTNIRTIRPTALTIVAALVFVASGCGSSSKSTTSAASATSATTTTASGGYGGSTSSTGTATTPQAPAGPAVAITSKSSKLGAILAAGPKRMTVYLFEGDTASTSACSAECAAVWPPLTGAATAGSGAMAADLGTITRSDGTKQVTYKGHPLYFYAKDGDKGDAYGQGLKSFGADWYVLAPSGKKVDKS